MTFKAALFCAYADCPNGGEQALRPELVECELCLDRMHKTLDDDLREAIKAEKSERSMTKLDELTDALTEVLDLTEHRFCTLVPGVAGRVPLDPAKPDSQAFGFGKVGETWRLYIEMNDGEKRALTSCSKRMRVEATHRLADLLIVLRGETLAQEQAIAEAIQRVDMFLANCGDPTMLIQRESITLDDVDPKE